MNFNKPQLISGLDKGVYGKVNLVIRAYKVISI